MKQHDDYIAGPHHYWLHFCCGLVFGAIVGAWIGWRFLDAGWPIVVTAIAVSFATAFTCGRYGDRGWQIVVDKIRWFS